MKEARAPPQTSPQRIYEILLDSKQFAAFTGMLANIDPAAGGAFSMFGRVIMGRNIELIPNQRIVQAWRPTRWDPGVYSIVKFELKTAGKRNDVDSRSFRISGRRIRPSLQGMEISILGTAKEVSRIRAQPNRLKKRKKALPGTVRGVFERRNRVRCGMNRTNP
jgi:uncharacterized protein YndB with AHSA1/START domain